MRGFRKSPPYKEGEEPKRSRLNVMAFLQSRKIQIICSYIK